MDAVVVGGAGFIGAHLVERLLADGHAVDVVDDLSSGSLNALATARAAAGTLRINTLDAASRAFADLTAMRRPAVIYHLATLTPGDAPPVEVAARTLASTVSVLDAARHAEQAKVVVVLPAADLYGEVPAREQPIKEARGWQPAGVRGVVARAVLELCQVYRADHDVEFTALVSVPVYGPRQRSGEGIVPRLVAARRARADAHVDGDGRELRDLLYVDDAVDALVRAATHAGGLAVNIGSGTGVTAGEVWAALGGRPEALHPTGSGRGPARLILNPTRARLQLGWSSWTTLADGLFETFNA